jgi:hypothetical protein
MPDWAGGLVVSAAWLVVAAGLARRSGRPLRRVSARLTDGGGAPGQRRSAAEIIQNRRNARYAAETEVRVRTEELVAAALHEFVAHEEESLEENVEAVERRSAVLVEIVKWTVGAPTGLALKALGLRATSER